MLPDEGNKGLAHFEAFIKSLRDQKEQLDSVDWDSVPEPPPEQSPRFYSLRKRVRHFEPVPEPRPVKEVRNELPSVILDYIYSDSQNPLLIRVPAGVGKTYAVVDVLQNEYKRTLWCSGRHDAFGDLMRFEHFNPDVWTHWQPLTGTVEKNGERVPMCREIDYQRVWMAKGYPAQGLCWQICDDWQGKCDYRCQVNDVRQMLFGMHQHLISGLAVSKFSVCVVDELPLSAFVNWRYIPLRGLRSVNVGGNVKAVLDTICRVVEAGKGTLSGKNLLNEACQNSKLGDVLGQIYKDFTSHDSGIKVDLPRIHDRSMVDTVEWFFVPELLFLLMAEQRAWAEGRELWAERVKVSKAGLHLLQKRTLWDKLPEKMILLDATGLQPLYEMMLDRRIDLYAPTVKRKGRIYQVCGRMNGKAVMTQDGDKPTKGLLQMVSAMRSVINRWGYKNPGVVCHKDARPFFIAELGDGRVMHFNANRGSNLLEDADGLFVMGTPGPKSSDVIATATALNPDRIETFYELDEEGKPRPAYRWDFRVYKLTPEAAAEFGLEDGEHFERLIGGYYDPALRSVHEQRREAEIWQAIGRGRPNTRDMDVWVFGAVPMESEPLDGLWEKPPISPDGIDWTIWLQLEPKLLEAHAEGMPVGRVELSAMGISGSRGRQTEGISIRWIAKNKWVRGIHDHMHGMWDYENDPNFKGKRGPKVQRLKPIE